MSSWWLLLVVAVALRSLWGILALVDACLRRAWFGKLGAKSSSWRHRSADGGPGTAADNTGATPRVVKTVIGVPPELVARTEARRDG